MSQPNGGFEQCLLVIWPTMVEGMGSPMEVFLGEKMGRPGNKAYNPTHRLFYAKFNAAVLAPACF